LDKWAEIARFLPGRTDTLVKNRWNKSARVAMDVPGHITVLPPVANGLSELDSPLDRPAKERGSVLAWLDYFKGKGSALVQPLWSE
jgi:hypothetical protein